MLAARIKAARQVGKVLNVSGIQEELMIAMEAPDNPYVLFPFNTDANIYTEIVKFGALHTPTIIDMVGMLITTHEATINGDTVIQTAFLYTQMVCSINSRLHSAYFKMLSVFLKTCGLTDTGLLALSKLGMCEAPRTLLDTKDNLAVLDEVMALRPRPPAARGGAPAGRGPARRPARRPAHQVLLPARCQPGPQGAAGRPAARGPGRHQRLPSPSLLQAEQPGAAGSVQGRRCPPALLDRAAAGQFQQIQV
jgi:hypothetical protein